MSVTVFKVPEEPILIAKFTGDVDGETIAEMYRLTAEILGNAKGVFYRISDFSMMATDHSKIVGVLRTAVQETAGGSTDPRIRPILLGDNRWVKLGQNALQNTVTMPIFERMHDAMEYARVQIARHKSGM